MPWPRPWTGSWRNPQMPAPASARPVRSAGQSLPRHHHDASGRQSRAGRAARRQRRSRSIRPRARVVIDMSSSSPVGTREAARGSCEARDSARRRPGLRRREESHRRLARPHGGRRPGSGRTLPQAARAHGQGVRHRRLGHRARDEVDEQLPVGGEPRHRGGSGDCRAALRARSGDA